MNRTKRILIVSASLFTMAASGQSYSIDWHTIGGGGGTSTGGGYLMNGVLGQLDAAMISGGGYTLEGGFGGIL